MLAVWDWNAIGATAGVIAVLLVVGGAVVKTIQDRIGRARTGARRLDLLEIRLFGLPADAETGAKKLDGEFDRIDKRLDDMPDVIISKLRENSDG